MSTRHVAGLQVSFQVRRTDVPLPTPWVTAVHARGLVVGGGGQAPPDVLPGAVDEGRRSQYGYGSGTRSSLESSISGQRAGLGNLSFSKCLSDTAHTSHLYRRAALRWQVCGCILAAWLVPPAVALPLLCAHKLL